MCATLAAVVGDRTEEEDPLRDERARSGAAPVAVAVHALPIRLGRYMLTKRLGVGGMAEVFLAQQDGPAGFQKTCVVKKILPHLALEPRFVAMFQREARVAALLHHTNVVQTFELGEEGGVYFIAMEYVDGPPLHHLARAAWRAGQPLPMELVSCAITDSALGLAAAHELTDRDGKPLGLIHRDISPDNLIINSEGVVKILDFGVAKIASGDRTATGELKGKLPFMAPEQIRGDEVDERIDIYALGVTAYWLLTGDRPFRAPSDLALMQTILAEPPRPLRELNPAIPPELEALVLQMLAKDPNARPRSASLIADALAETTAGRRHAVAPFVKQMETLIGAPPEESSPRTGDFRAATPKSATFAVACSHIAEHLGATTAPDLLAAPTLKMARPMAPLDTQPTGTRIPDASRTELALDAPTAGLSSDADGAGRGSWRLAVGAGAVLALVIGAVTVMLRGPPTTNPADLAPSPPLVSQRDLAPPNAGVDTAPVATPDASPAASAGGAPIGAASVSDAGPEPTAMAPVDAPVEPEPEPSSSTRARRRAESGREVTVKGPAHVQWLDARGHSLGAGNATVRVGGNDKKIVAVDRLRNARTVVPLSGGVVDYAALPRGKLQLRANPYADVTIGRESLGTTPFPPVDVVAGTYTVKFRYQGREEVRTVEVAAGATVRAAVDFGG